jgi:hypothetical protein
MTVTTETDGRWGTIYNYDVTEETWNGETENMSGTGRLTNPPQQLIYTREEGAETSENADRQKVYLKKTMETMPRQITRVFQKTEGDRSRLTIRFYSDNELVASSTTTRPYGVVRASHIFDGE